LLELARDLPALAGDLLAPALRFAFALRDLLWFALRVLLAPLDFEDDRPLLALPLDARR
jgi:hypothetical protein